MHRTSAPVLLHNKTSLDENRDLAKREDLFRQCALFYQVTILRVKTMSKLSNMMMCDIRPADHQPILNFLDPCVGKNLSLEMIKMWVGVDFLK